MNGLLRHLLLGLLTLVLTAALGEMALRIKNKDQRSYTIEMWRYARELKQVAGPDLGHVHIPGRAARLQNVDFRINSLGMRGPEPRLDAPHRVMVLGSSIALGWGVEEEKTLSARLEAHLGDGWEVMNGGIGNFNAERSVTLFERQWRQTVKPDVVVMLFFLRDAEQLAASQSNWLMANSELAVTLYYIVTGFTEGAKDISALVRHYNAVYSEDSPGFAGALQALDRLNEMGRADGFKVVLAMMPDIHQLQNYPFVDIHARMKAVAARFGWSYVDLYDTLAGFKGPELWTIPGDPHPNARAHELMAERLAPVVAGRN
jgi:lysophospholipase L1-like esterase